MAYSAENPQKAEFMRRIGADARKIREQTEATCEMVANVLNETNNRDRISKFERGISGMTMYDYLLMMWWYKDVEPDHPAVALARMMLPEDVKRWKLWTPQEKSESEP
jgi:hypothetical protein